MSVYMSTGDVREQGEIQTHMMRADMVEDADIREDAPADIRVADNRDVESPVIASADADAPPAPYDPSDLDAERARMFRAAGVDVIDLLRRAAITTLRFLGSDDAEHALRAADQAYRLAGAYSGKDGSGKGSGKVSVNVNVASFAQPRGERPSA